MAIDITKHKNTLIKILKDVYTDTTLGPILGLKGGTACYLFYRLNRFSVDLDFDLLDKSKEDYVFQKMKEILENYGTLKDASKKRFNLFYLFSYKEKQKEAQNIKVEINLRDFGSRYEIKSYLGIPMKVMVKEDMVAHKLVAMYERKGRTNRDLYDVWFFLKENWEVNKEIVERRAKMKFKDFLKKCILLVEKIDQRRILAGIGELLDEKTKIWVKKNLKNDLLFLLKIKLESEK